MPCGPLPRARWQGLRPLRGLSLDGDEVMNPYERKRADRIERMRVRAGKLANEADATLTTARATADRIPMGQPILIGHASEGRHRRDLARIDSGMRKGFALADEAQKLERRV